MAVFPSRIEFAAFLQYAPRGSSTISAASRDVAYKVKQDGFIRVPQQRGGTTSVRVIDYAAKRLAEEIPRHPFLGDYFNPSVSLVPVPRSSPQKPGSLWPTLRICEEILAQGLSANVLSCLKRTQPVQKSATAGPGQRPDPEAHYNSAQVVMPGFHLSPKAITLVDDVVTRGSTFVGLAKRLEEAFPGVEIRCFALIRTISGGEVPTILDPVKGTVTYSGGQLNRHT
jgi:hypothetical protein